MKYLENYNIVKINYSSNEDLREGLPATTVYAPREDHIGQDGPGVVEHKVPKEQLY